MPEAWKVNPVLELDPYEKDIYDAFFDISDERNLGFGVGRIPLSKIVWYLEFYLEMHDEEYKEDFKYIIRRLDAAWIEMIEQKPKEEEKQRK